MLIFSLILKNTFFVLFFMPEDKVLQKGKKSRSISSNPFTHAGSSSHWSSGLKLHRSSSKKKKKRKKDKKAKKDGGKVSEIFTIAGNNEASGIPRLEKKEGMKKDEGVRGGREVCEGRQ